MKCMAQAGAKMPLLVSVLMVGNNGGKALLVVAKLHPGGLPSKLLASNWEVPHLAMDFQSSLTLLVKSSLLTAGCLFDRDPVQHGASSWPLANLRCYHFLQYNYFLWALVHASQRSINTFLFNNHFWWTIMCSSLLCNLDNNNIYIYLLSRKTSGNVIREVHWTTLVSSYLWLCIITSMLVGKTSNLSISITIPLCIKLWLVCATQQGTIVKMFGLANALLQIKYIHT